MSLVGGGIVLYTAVMRTVFYLSKIMSDVAKEDPFWLYFTIGIVSAMLVVAFIVLLLMNKRKSVRHNAEKEDPSYEFDEHPVKDTKHPWHWHDE